MSTDTNKLATTLSGHVANHLRGELEARKLTSGETISFDQLAKKLGVSRTPVREAIRQLALEGLIVSTPGKGAQVSTLGSDDINHLYQIRQTLECAAVRMSANFISGYELEILQRNEALYTQNIDSPDMLAKLDKQFHTIIYETSHNRYLEHILKSIRVTMGLLNKDAYIHPNRIKDTLFEHQEIIAALLNRDATAAERAVSKHIENARLERLRYSK